MGTPSRQSSGIDYPVAIRSGEGAHVKWCRELRCSPRVTPACRGTFGVASRVPSTVLHVKMERGTSLETLYRVRASSCDDEGTTCFFSSFSGISSYDGEFRLPLVLAQEVQSSIQLVKESWGLLSRYCRAKRPHLGLCPGTNVPLQGPQGYRGPIPVELRASGLVSRRSKGLRSPLETRPDSPGKPGMQPRDPCCPWRGTLCRGQKRK